MSAANSTVLVSPSQHHSVRCTLQPKAPYVHDVVTRPDRQLPQERRLMGVEQEPHAGCRNGNSRSCTVSAA